ncbi:SMP-30/gluconolactonase/LRE family protein [Antrihabitans cavernicola]|uniref:SMP-30/gluconolactonase/LRE family protein n=1 Tax=Antrihabitans cavernicola TaxID=2495913 RepID=A0A5A7S644_9NOCA|nr:SMP-30/gluconolactonase/LRE family protein [Spelaeibacter cavernicola]KAA0018535.1 SMP-30/gluconolactonase/LRE family protein [Spelaeibacter cavernicola]
MPVARIHALILAAAMATGTATAAAPAQAAPISDCAGWQVDTIAQGLGELENLVPDPNGGFYVSSLSAGIQHVDAGGRVRPVLPGVPAGGMSLARSNLYFVGGSDSGFRRLDTATGQQTLLARPGGNGLLRLPGGDLLTTWVGTEGLVSSGVSRYHHDTGVVEANWSTVPRSEGLALSPDHKYVYTDDLLTSQIIRIPLDAPKQWTVVGTVPALYPGVDDLTMSQAGALYVAAHIEGAIHRFDPNTGRSCVIASGLSIGWTGPASVRIGPDGTGWALFATLFDGSLRRLRPPPGVDLAPVQNH